MIALQSLAAEFAITVTDGAVWLAIGQALLFGGVCLLFGVWVARRVGLLASDAPAGETLGVGLASGLMVLAAWWAAIWSGGRSSFTPVAVGFAIAIALAVVRRAPAPTDADPVETDGDAGRWSHYRSLALTTLAGGVFVVAIALLYGSTMAPSPRDGVQPIENPDAAFYSVLGRDLAATGTETNIPPSGFSDVPGLPSQIWYHWGELWLASAVFTIFGAAPLAARYLIVLPVVLLAAAALTGTLVRRMSRSNSRRAYLFGFLVCLFLAPVPLIPGPYFSSWAFGLVLGITLYGLAAVAVPLTLYSLVVLGTRMPTWGLAAYVGSAVAFIVPAHVVIAVLALVGVGTIWTIRTVDTVIATGRLPTVLPIWRRTFIATGTALVATVAWGVVTGHGLGGSGGLPPSISPFNPSWSQSVVITALGAGMFLAIPIAWFLARTEAPLDADIYLGTTALVLIGAIMWGAWRGDFNTFYLFFGGIAVFATPLGAVAVWRLLERLRETRHLTLAAGVVVVCVLQLTWGVFMNGVPSLVRSGPLSDRRPIPIALLAVIRQLPADAKLAYACRPFEEATFVEPQLLSIDVHTGRRVVPMCFEADVASPLIGAEWSAQTPNASFAWAPQRVLYPDAAAQPSSLTVATFLKENLIGYIYADAIHPNSLVADSVPLARTGDVELLRIP